MEGVLIPKCSIIAYPPMTCFFIFSLEGKSDFVTNNCDAKPVLINNKSVAIIISKIIKIGLCLRIGKELMTEIPAGTNRINIIG